MVNKYYKLHIASYPIYKDNQTNIDDISKKLMMVMVAKLVMMMMMMMMMMMTITM